jgi:CheY-like chemotaxis protein
MISRAVATSEISQILIAECDHEVRALLKNTFFRSGYEVCTCGSGAEFLHRARIQTDNPQFPQLDLVLCDIRILDDDTIKSLLQLREKSKPMPIVLMHQFMGGKAQAIAVQLRAAAVIYEPTNTIGLLSTVRHIVPPVKPSGRSRSKAPRPGPRFG